MRRYGSLRLVFIVLACMTAVIFCGEALAGEGAKPAARAQADQLLIDQLKRDAGDHVRITTNARTGRVNYIGADPAHPLRQPAALSGKPTPEQAARGFLSVYGPLLGVQDQARQLRVMRTSEANGGRSFVRFQQLHAGVPVFGGESIVQVDSSSNIISVHSKLLPNIGGDTSPVVTPEAAAATAKEIFIKSYRKKYQFDAASLRVSAPELWIYNPLLAGFHKDVTYLVWRIEITPSRPLPIREIILVDAHTGAVVLHFNQNPTAKDREIYDNHNNPSLGLPGPNLIFSDSTIPPGPPPISGTLPDDNYAYDFSGFTYDFYLNHFNRDSLDGAGMPLVATTQYCPDSLECPYANAYWDSVLLQMVYGQGFAYADDVVGHEMTHGVTQFTSDLNYLNESGAINESISDIFGEFIDLTDLVGNDGTTVRWLIGEDLPIGAIRNMKNPPAFHDPDRMGSKYYYCGTCDQGGVHTNSGVGNKAAFLLTDGGSFNGLKVIGIGINKAAQIYYEAETNLLVSTSDYDDLANALVQGCMDLVVGTCYDGTIITYADCTQVANAVNAVEMMYLDTRPPQSYVLDGGFEAGPSAAWTESSSGGYELIIEPETYDPPFEALCGDWEAWLGGYTALPPITPDTMYAIDYIYQDIFIPADATVAQLQFAYFIYTYEVGGVWDKMAVQIRDPGTNALLKTLTTFSNKNSTTAIKTSPAYNLLKYKGQTIRIQFYATNDYIYPTSFFIDDVVVKVSGIRTPGVATFAINGGKPTTTKRLVTLNNKVTKALAGYTPTEYLASEDPDFAGASWLPYSTKPSFTLSPLGGTKEVFFMVRNSVGDESAAVSDTIEALAPVLSTFSINKNAASTTSDVVKLNNKCLNAPTEYQASEDALFTGASWLPYATAPQFTLSGGTGTKTVYFKVRNDFAESAAPPASDTITLN